MAPGVFPAWGGCFVGPNVCGVLVPLGAYVHCPGPHRGGQTAEWHGFYLEPEEQQAVWETAFATFHGDASSLELDCMRGVTVYVDNSWSS